jgi:RIO kinase 1
LEKAYNQVIEGMALLYQAGLVHSDLSEFNMLYWQKNVHIIDIGQAVLLDHPLAKHFFERDCYNIARYFHKRGLKTDKTRVYEEVKAKTA